MDIKLRTLKDSNDDYEKLFHWCQHKFVYEWFEQRVLSYNEIVSKYQKKLRDNIQDLFIIVVNNKDIGLVQIYKYNDNISCISHNSFNNLYEYDLFIGEEDYLNKGIGTDIVNFANNKIFREYHADAIVLRPFKRNIRAIKCYLKCGYNYIKSYEGCDTLGNKEIISVLINKNN